ncbi:MAG: error-prone DNA polymerase [Henriciella sp.]|jgi:error-prone DNA polymerase|uniref:error-prone DNA polymerase n=1 Tax=Henriciella sp. TaxID=1968823 RepID=UPI000C0EE38F|nr:error-prone DNA polymerase [Henriciella sp.]MAN74045.1 error-prone DNA polymerase [Henriciella sp.]PHR74851.1 MAG: error-prone DNA polymerase [Henriciella sp.]|tara:strand:- start:47350 stop:50706 length:3357 start_codon:yes stop_codon:yes gene_type:complete
MTGYTELAVTTNFSFLRGASHPEELVAQARGLGLAAIGIADRNTLAGVVRAHLAAKEHDMRLLVGARLVTSEGIDLIAYPQDRAAYGRLSRLLSEGKRRAPKGDCHITLEDVMAHSDGQVFIAIPPPQPAETYRLRLEWLRARWGDRLYLGARYSFQGQNRERIARLADLGLKAGGVPIVAVNDVLYHAAERRPLQDVVTCIREHCTVDEAGFRLEANAERHIKPPEEMARLFKGFEPALRRTLEIAERCRFSLDELAYEYPDEPVPPGKTPQEHIETLAWAGAHWRYPGGVPDKVRKAITKELGLIRELDYAPYFITVHDIVDWARKQDILCQGRGSAANSAVCYCLGITSVDPSITSLLFERFLSKERKEPPDIDVDFEHERREEVIQYVYRRYGRHKAALTATVISYRPRSAVREVCKALGLSADIASALAGTVWGSFGSDVKEKQIRQAGLDPANPVIRRAVQLTRQLIGFPRHLSQHVGGFVLTRGPLVETVPIGNAAMEERTFIEWDKDDISALGIMKVDVLALGMLTCIRKAFDLLRLHKGLDYTLASIPQDDAATYDMLCKGDSLGVFQVESRAQMNMLPRLRPRVFYDLVIEVAIVRPGPIQGDMVHPYLRRRNGQETVTYPAPAPDKGPADELETILKRTNGVPLFQEQAMQIAMDAAKFSADEANGLRRAMATFRKVGTIQNYEEMMVERMVDRGYERAFAQRCFDQVKGFGEYGFPESHAASFALLVYVSSWLKCHHPDVFCAALLNSQPMGFYAPAQIVRDAREHGVEVRAADVNLSDWDNILEPSGLSARGYSASPDAGPCASAVACEEKDREEASGLLPPPLAVRLGFRQIDGLREEEMEEMLKARGPGFEVPEDIRRRTGLSRRAMETLAAADAFRSMKLDRRAALWAARGEAAGKTLPLFAAADTAEQGRETATPLPRMPQSEHVLQDYQTTRLSLKAHPMSFLREHYSSMRTLSTKDACNLANGTRAQTAGIVLVRQRPGSASGVCFITIEDETGVANLVVWPNVFERFRAIVMGARIILVKGRIQRAEGVTHLVAEQLVDRTADLSLLSETTIEDPMKAVLSNADEVVSPIPDRRGPPRRTVHTHPRNVRIIPNSRDFH